MPIDKLYSLDNVKLLLLFMLKSLGHPLSRVALTDACLGSRAADFYLIGPALEALLESGQLVEDLENDLVALTALGEETIDELSRRIPLSVRERAVAKAATLVRGAVRAEQVKAETVPCKGGFQVTLKIVDGECTLLSLSMFSPTEVQAHILCDNFRRAHVSLYADILKALTALRQ